MGYFAEEIAKGAAEIGVSFSLIDKVKALQIKARLAPKFTDEGNHPKRLSWQNLKNVKSIHDPDAWELIEEFAPREEVILFIDPSEEEVMWCFNNGTDLVAVLAECIPFPFCVISGNADYMLCFDDHDCLIGVGTAADWIETLR